MSGRSCLVWAVVIIVAIPLAWIVFSLVLGIFGIRVGIFVALVPLVRLALRT